MKECEVLPQGLRWCRCSWRPSRTCLLGSPWHSERSGAWRLGHRPAPPTWLPKKEKTRWRETNDNCRCREPCCGWMNGVQQNKPRWAEGRRPAPRTRPETGPPGWRSKEEPSGPSGCRAGRVWTQVRTQRDHEKTGQTLSSELNWWRCFLAES